MGKRARTDHQFGNKLRKAREDAGLSQADVAKQLRDKDLPMHWTTIAKIEHGDRSVRIDEAAAIADLFGVSIDSMINRAADLQEMKRLLVNATRRGEAAASEVSDELTDRWNVLQTAGPLHVVDPMGHLPGLVHCALDALGDVLNALLAISTYEGLR